MKFAQMDIHMIGNWIFAMKIIMKYFVNNVKINKIFNVHYTVLMLKIVKLCHGMEDVNNVKIIIF